MRRITVYALIIVTLALVPLAPRLLQAQDELTLEGLSQRLDAIATGVAELAGRVNAIEALFEGPGSIAVDDLCIIGGYNGGEQQVQDQTVMNYKNEFDEFPDVDYLAIRTVAYNPEKGEIIIVYRDTENYQKLVIANEVWDGCDLVRTEDWAVQER